LRSEHLVGVETFKWVDAGAGCLAFERGSVVVIVNFGPEPVVVPGGEVLLASSKLEEGLIPPDATIWVGV